MKLALQSTTLAAICVVTMACTNTADTDTATATATATAVEAEQTTKEIIMDSIKKIESISNPSIQGDVIVFQALSFGCTKSADFVAEAVAIDNSCQVTIQRIKPDFCKAAPELKKFSTAWEVPAECEGLPVLFTNPEFEK